MRLICLSAFALVSCTSQPESNAVAPENTATPAAEAAPSESLEALPPVEPAAPGTPGGLDNDTTPVSEAPFTEDSAQGAANVVQTYYALVEAGKYRQAYALWEPGAAGMTARAFAESFARYREYHARIGAPGRIDAGAGQRYVTVPVQVYGRLKQGNRPFDMRGSVTLHRTADIPGATAAQKRWRIRSTDIKPRPGEPAPVPSPSSTADNRSTARYRCDDGTRLVANFDPDRGRVTLRRGGERLGVLSQRRAASGIHYAAKGIDFRGKGRQATLTLPGKPPIACTATR